jgi:ribosome-associated toxin RatA of RatAB toxin-antitoxin module
MMVCRTAWFVSLFLSVVPARAGEQRVIGIGGQRVVVKVTESYDETSMIRAECVIPRSQRVVWNVLCNYDSLADMVPALNSSRIVGEDEKGMILHQEGGAGFWFFKRDFSVTFRVKEVPMSYIGFDAFEGDFRTFKGSWQIAEGEAGTWVSHRVEIEPDFFVPKWALRRMARKMMFQTIENVIDHCLEMPALYGEERQGVSEHPPGHR